MKVLILGPSPSPLTPIVRQSGHDVIETPEPIDARFITKNNVDFLISYGCRFIIRNDVLSLLPDRAINLHISFLPWNRGADPNLWSFLEDTPKGVTIHYLDEGLDTGDIISQVELHFNEETETLATTYEALSNEIVRLFKETWPGVAVGKCPRIPQPAGGSCHRTADRSKYSHLLTRGWDTPVRSLIGRAPKTNTNSR